MSELTCPKILTNGTVATSELRKDIAIQSSEKERQIIIDNFPKEKNNYLVVPKVIEE